MTHDYESRDLFDNRSGVAVAALGVVLLVVIGFGAAWVAKATSVADERAATLGKAIPAAATPADEVTGVRLAAEAAWDARARLWAWTDREAGLARIPVDRAAELLLARGFPARPEPARPAGGGP